MEDVTKIAKSLEDSGLLIKGISEKIQNKTKEEKRGLFGMLLGTLGARLLRNILAGKGMTRARHDSTNLRSKGDGIVRAGRGY